MNKATKALLILGLAYVVSGCPFICKVMCAGESERTKVPVPGVFAGQVVSNFGNALDGATVTVNKQSTTTDSNGFFKLKSDLSERYLVTITKSRYAPLSKIYDRGIEGKKWRLTQATVVVADPRKPITVRDVLSSSGCLGTRGVRSPWELLAVSGGPTPPELARALDAADNLSGCSPGIAIAIPANALIDANGVRPSGNVEVELATVDVFSPDSMPGDFGVLLPDYGDGDDYKGNNKGVAAGSNSLKRGTNVRRGFMQTFGAGYVSVKAGSKSYQLAPGIRAKLEIPIDPSLLDQLAESEQDPTPTIPLLLYDDTLGVWRPEGTAILNETKNAYEAELSHFSTFNMDVVFTQQSCIQVDSRLINGSYHLRLVMPEIPLSPPTLPPHDFNIPNSLQTCTGTTSTDPFECFVHSAWNLPSTTQYSELGTQKAAFEPSKDGVQIGIFEVPFGPAHGSIPLPPAYDSNTHSYPACTNRVILSDKPTLTMTMAPKDQVTLTMSAYWGANPTLVPIHPSDGFRIEQCQVSGSETCMPKSNGWSSFTKVTVPSGRTPPPVTFNIGNMPAGNYKLRVKARVGDSSFGSNGTDTTPSDPVELKVTKLRIVNNIVLDTEGSGKVLRVRTAVNSETNARGPVATEHMTPDGCHDNDVQREEIPPIKIYDVTYWKFNGTAKTWSDPYKLFIGLGLWAEDSQAWPSCALWAKKHFAINPADDTIRGYRFFELNVTDTNHPAGQERTLSLTGNGGYGHPAFIDWGTGTALPVTQQDNNNPIPDGG